MLFWPSQQAQMLIIITYTYQVNTCTCTYYKTPHGTIKNVTTTDFDILYTNMKTLPKQFNWSSFEQLKISPLYSYSCILLYVKALLCNWSIRPSVSPPFISSSWQTYVRILSQNSILIFIGKFTSHKKCFWVKNVQ